MPTAFRFLVICLGAIQRLDDKLVTLSGIVNHLEANGKDPVEIAAIVGMILAPDMKGKPLDLMAWKLGKNGEPTPIPGYAGTPLILPDGLGPLVLPYSISLPIQDSGIYGFYLFDREGVFGPKEELLATYTYSVSVK